MISLLNIPKLNYIVFELLRFPIQDGIGSVPIDNKKVEEVGIVVMDVLPEEISYSMTSRKAKNMDFGDFGLLIDRGGLGAEKISFSGTFGNRFINRGLKLQNGFGRFKEFRELFRKSQSVEDAKEKAVPGSSKYVYGLNFYDFTFHWWGSVDLENFQIKGNARNHAQLPYYSVQMEGVRKLINVKTKDPILRNLNMAIELQNKLDEFNTDIENFIDENGIASGINEVLVDFEMFKSLLDGIDDLAGQYWGAINEVPVRSGITSIIPTLTKF